MKIRKGFVSNSSSSSFIVHSDIDLSKLNSFEFDELIGDFQIEYHYGCYVPISTFTYEILLALINGQVNDDNQLIHLLEQYYYYEIYSKFEKLNIQDNEENLLKFKEELRIFCLNKLEELKKKFKYIYVVNYADEDGEGHLEHGDIFRNIEHLKISLH